MIAVNKRPTKDVEKVCNDGCSCNADKRQYLLFFVIPSLRVRQTGTRCYRDIIYVHITGKTAGAHTVSTVYHMGIKVLFEADNKQAVLEDIIVVEIFEDVYLDKPGPDRNIDDNKGSHTTINAAAN